MIELALGRYLRDAPHPSVEAFKRSALQSLQHYIGDRVFIARNPEESGKYCITITKVNAVRNYELSNQVALIHTTLQIDVWGKGDHASTRTIDLADKIRRACAPYSGYWGATWVNSVEVVRESQFSDRPEDGTIYWDFRSSADYEISWQDFVELDE